MIECPICCQHKPKLYSIFKCSHEFCEDCLKGHITEKSSRFTTVLCPQPDCKNALKENLSIISQLPQEVQHRLKKHEEFLELQKNPTRACSVPNCTGRIDMNKKKKVCSKCFLPHCPKCFKGFHEGGCVLDEHDQMMKNLQNQKCPQCGIWVEKKEGCDYIDCKCGTAFCYRCGAKFSQDPCRKNELWKKQIEVRKALQKMQFRLPNQISAKFTKILLLPFKLLFLTIITIAFSIVLTIGVGIFFVFIIIACPFLVVAIICDTQKIGHRILLIIALPVLSVLLAAFLILVMLLFPLMRNVYHHGIYDGVQSVMNGATLCYLEIATKILDFQ